LDLTNRKFANFTGSELLAAQPDLVSAEGSEAWNCYGVNLTDEPQTVKQALSGPDAKHWKEAMDSELKSLSDQQTWTLVNRPDGRSIIKNKWVFKVKRNVDGSVNRYKARLVAKGYTQKFGVDYDEVFSPVIRGDTIRILFAVAQKENFHLKQLDVVGAYLYGKLDEELYMEEPDGFQTKSGGAVVCKLNKALYGLKQSARTWNHHFADALKEFGLTRSLSDNCLFMNAQGTLFLAFYVDDCICAAKEKKELDKLLTSLKQKFKVTVGDVDCFLGIQVERNKDFILLHQEAYIKKVVSQFGMEGCNPVQTPFESGLSIWDLEGHQKNEALPYRELIGSLMFIAVWTRPDISHAVSVLSQYFDSASDIHWNAAKRVLRYLSGTLRTGIKFGGGNTELIGYSDADFGGDKGRSRSGVVFLLNNGPITWMSRKQTVTSTSTCQAEYVAAFEATKQAVWLRRILTDLGLKPKGPTVINIDNEGAICVIKNPGNAHNRTKHWDVKHHYLQDMYSENIIKPVHVPSKKELADFLTKPLTIDNFRKNLMQLNMM
jgi:hypothetical protein